jgi:hypothetical protein
MATKNKQVALYLDDEMMREVRRGVGTLQIREQRHVSTGDLIRRAIVFFLVHEVRTMQQSSTQGESAMAHETRAVAP